MYSSGNILKICDLDLDLHGQIGLNSCKIFVLILPIWNFSFTLKLFIDHLNPFVNSAVIGLFTGEIVILTS